MKLLKVSVPNFRNLQNVDLTFEPDLSPAVFPIASQNGGGKSTLLQLIFTLFHCAANHNRYQYITNLFNTNRNLEDNKTYNIANFDFSYKKRIVSVSFNVVKFNSIDRHSLNEDVFEILYEENRLIKKNKQDLLARKTFLSEKYNKTYLDNFDNKEQAEAAIAYLQTRLKHSSEDLNKIHKAKIKLNKENNILYSLLMDFEFDKDETSEDSQILYCSIENDVEYDFAIEAFTSISKNIFLAAPSTQPFIFLDKLSKKELFNNLSKYCQLIIEKKEELPNLYLYSQLTISELIETFTRARDRDWKQALKSDNLAYGSNIKKLTDDFHDFLGHDKYILPTPDLDSVIVQKQISETERIELEPEDLSHGELRRLGLYAWIKYNIPENSIILIDEVENALHPDWQYNIADELASWGNNQYLLATHSFHLCEALTPKHVKEIEPKMCPKGLASHRKPSSEVIG